MRGRVPCACHFNACRLTYNNVAQQKRFYFAHLLSLCKDSLVGSNARRGCLFFIKEFYNILIATKQQKNRYVLKISLRFFVAPKALESIT